VPRGSGETEVSDENRLVAGRYRLSRQLGRGGMGTVWLAEDALLDRRVAVKKLHVPPQLEEDERARLYERTRREARSAARISHPGVIVVHDVVEEQGLPCIVMEYVASRSLSDVLRENGPLAHGEAARIGLGMAAALRAAHAAGVLHRDVKPANVLLSGDGERVVLTDFGIAAASDTETLTRTGEFVGSIDYSAPERMRGDEAGPAADAWALGATLYEAVEGEAPFRRESWMETAYAASSEPPRPMQQAGVLSELITGLLEKDPADRITVQRAEEWLAGAAGTVPLPAPQEDAGQPAAQAPPVPQEPVPSPAPPAPAPTPPVPVPSSGPVPPRRPAGPTPRRRLGLHALAGAAVVVAAVAIAGGTWWLTRDQGGTSADGGSGAGSTKPSASQSAPSPSASPSRRPPVAEGYHRVKDPLGFSVDIPDGWTRRAEANGQQVNYVGPSGLTGLKFGVLDFAGESPLRHWRDIEPEVEEKSPGYRKLRMNATSYQGQDAALWEYTWQGRARQYHAVDLGFGTEGERQYAIYLSAPHTEWGSSKKFFDTAVDSFRTTSKD
jgi:eukaryotic-like serine/threonine-protein kinase